MATRKSTARARTIAVVGFEDAQLLDVTGPLEVFGATNRWLRANRDAPPAYTIAVLSPRGRTFRTSTGVRIVADGACVEPRRDIDTFLVAGGAGVGAAMKDAKLLSWIRETAKHTRRHGSVCTGAFLLGAAGLLDERRAATHWASCDELAKLFPRVTVDRDAIFVRDGACVTSAGVTAGMDLALALVEEDLDRTVALAVARHLVLFLVRSGSQSQYSAHLSAQHAEREPLREVQTWIAQNPGADLTVPALAKRAHQSPRQFARVFRAETGVTPAKYVAAVRLDAARALLERTRAGLDDVASRSGFGNAEAMRRHFIRRFGTSPSVYRNRFAKEPS